MIIDHLKKNWLLKGVFWHINLVYSNIFLLYRSMKLFLIRHGEAESAATNPQRPLSHRGQLEIITLAEQLQQHQLAISEIRCSQKTRAQETATIIAKALNVDHPIAIATGLNPMDPLENCILELENRSEDLMLVGHNPFMENLVFALTKKHVSFHTGTMVVLLRREGEWEVEE